MKKFLIYAIIPALIAGFFSLAPKIYDIAKEPSAELAYTITTGPELQVGSNFRRILSIRITNAGKKSLHGVQANLVLSSGSIESFRVQDPSGLSPQVKEAGNSISVTVSTFHPKEHFALSAMTLIPNMSVSEEFNLRSDEVLGRLTKETGEKKKPLDIIGAVLSSFSVFFMIIVFYLRVRQKGVFPGYDREDIIFFIFVRLGLTQLTETIRFTSAELKYIRAADVLMEHGLRADPETKSRCITALECFFLIPGIAKSSLAAAGQDLALLLGSDTAADRIAKVKELAKRQTGDKDIRHRIEQYIRTATSHEFGKEPET